LEEAFHAYLEDYFSYYSDLTFAEFRRSQQGLVASVAFGAAGISFAHWYAAWKSNSADLAHHAERWIRSAEKAQRGARAFVCQPVPGGSKMPPGAVLYGKAGIWMVSALVAHALAKPAAAGRAIERWAALSESPSAPYELYTGVAGSLVAAAILFDHLGDPRAERFGRKLAARLTAAIELDRSGRASWPDAEGPWLAHGTAGPLLALVLWSRATGLQAPDWLGPAIERLLEEPLADPDRAAPKESERSWLCRGYSGLAHLAIQAGRLFGAPAFLPAARRALDLSLAHPSAQADLCCGRLATAAVCLEMAGEEPNGAWRSHAEQAIVSALLLDREDWEVAGLYGGEAALPCLVLDFLNSASAGPPGLSLLSDLSPHQA
jgi:hypothetical protein